MQYLKSLLSSFLTNHNIITSIYILYILEQLSLAAPREYVHPALVLGLDQALYCIRLYEVEVVMSS
jgi:hypothetical protein